VSRLYDRERGALSAALTPAVPRLRSCYPGNVVLGLGLHTQTKSLSKIVHVGWLPVIFDG